MINNLLLQKTLKTSNPIKEFLPHFLIKNDLGLTVGTALTNSQRANLKQDIVWMETVEISDYLASGSPCLEGASLCQHGT